MEGRGEPFLSCRPVSPPFQAHITRRNAAPYRAFTWLRMTSAFSEWPEMENAALASVPAEDVKKISEPGWSST